MHDPIHEHDMVVVLQDVPDAGLTIGDVGCVVHLYRDGTTCEVEFPQARKSPAGGDSGVVTLPVSQLLNLKGAAFRGFAKQLAG